MKIKYYGHSCFHLEIGNKSLLFDPFISPNELASSINVETLPCDYMLISHGHEDHIADADSIAKRTGALIVSNYEIVSWFQKNGHSNGHGMNIGGRCAFDFGSIKYVNAVHSSMLPDGSYGGNPGGFLIKAEGKTIYYAGDTALFSDMQLVAPHQPDIAFLPIGDNFTMGIEDAVSAAELINCSTIIGMHYDTFPPIKIDHEEAVEKFRLAGKKLTLMNIGSSIELS
jgi:L-ascorbate metabolism protein UlaG (beta-lactamase superfamily)